MIIQSHDSLPELIAPQVSSEDRGETNGAETFIQLLLQDVRASEQPAALLASALNLPLLALAFQSHLLGQPAEASGSDIPDLDGTGETADAEQERRALESILQALQDLFPAMIPVLPMLPLTASASAGGDALALAPSAGGPVASRTGRQDGSSPHTGDLLPAAGVMRQLLVPGSSGAPAPIVSTAQSGSMTDSTENAVNSARAQTPLSAAALASQRPAQEEAVLSTAMRDSQPGAADVSASGATSAQQLQRLTLPDATVLTSEGPSHIPRVRTPSSLRQPVEGASAPAAALGEMGRLSVHPAETRFSVAPPATEDLPGPIQPPESLAMGTLRYFPRSSVLLQLEPPGLGTLLVHVRQMDEKLTASFWTESSDLRSLLQSHFPALNQVLSQQGLSVQQVSLHLATGDGTPEQFGQFSQQQSAAHPFSQGNHGEGAGGRRRALVSPTERQEHSSGRVDITI